jgi:DNA-binding NarL/FixJ family response regulator
MQQGIQSVTKSAHKIFVVDDHPLFRQGLASLIDRQPGFKVCGEAESAEEALAAMSEMAPDAAVVDLSLRNGSGIELIRSMKSKLPHMAVVVLSMHDERHYAERSIRAGARGYVMKSETPNTVIEALSQVLNGQLYLSEQMRTFAVEKFVRGGPASVPDPQDVLSNREMEVFKLLGEGLETRRIAEILGLNIKTVQTFCAKIKDKLHLANASELMRESVRWAESGNAL